jgi:CheY-like chemotaxis protein
MTSTRTSVPTALVVDDQEVSTLLMRKTLERGGFRVLSANNSADAVNLCRETEPPIDLLVTDYRMPEMTGVDLAYACCAFNGGLRVLYVSGSMPGDDLRADLATGKRGFLAKPFRQADLLRSAQAVLALEPLARKANENKRSPFERVSLQRYS